MFENLANVSLEIGIQSIPTSFPHQLILSTVARATLLVIIPEFFKLNLNSRRINKKNTTSQNIVAKLYSDDSYSFACQQGYGKGSACTQYTLYTDCTFMYIYDLLGDGKPQAVTAM